MMLLLALVTLSISAHIEFEVIVPTYNNARWCIKNIESLVCQDYPHWHATVIVDAATDTTAQQIQNYIAQQA